MSKLLNKKQLKEIIGYSYQHIDRLEKARRFPLRVKPFGLNGRAFWVEQEIDDWIQQKIEERDSC
jgi:prophage regulatory protein